MLDMKKFYLFLRKHGRKQQRIYATMLKLKADGDPHYDAYFHGLAEGQCRAYQNVAVWVKQCQEKEK